MSGVQSTVNPCVQLSNHCSFCLCSSLGPVVEALSGRQRFVSVYAASAIMGAFASYVFNTSPSVGASGMPRALMCAKGSFSLQLYA